MSPYKPVTPMKHYTFNAPLPFELEIKELSEVTQRFQQLSGVPHRTDFYEVVWVQSGESIQMVDFVPIKLVAGQILLIGRNQVVKFDTSQSYEGKIILFTDLFFSRTGCEIQLMKLWNLFNPFTCNTPIVVNNQLKTFFELLIEECSAKHDPFQSDLVYSLLHALLIESARQSMHGIPTTKNQDYATALQFSKLVESHYASWRKVNDYLDEMSITAKPLSKALQAIIGKTPKQYIDERIILEAKRLLVYTTGSVKEISYKLGFEEPTNFSKFFREQTDLTPAEFKKENLA
ncbi:MAG: helix-turn-helix domain-containing protein [Phocaeicola sp.]